MLALAGIGLVLPLVWALRPAPVRVEIAEVSAGLLQVTVDEEGKTRIRNVYVVSAPLTGKLRRSPLDPGDAVVRDETVVAAIEPMAPTFLDERSRKEAEARVAAARAAVSLAEAEVRQSESELDWAASELRRTQALSKTNVVSARAIERARIEHDKQGALAARAKANLEIRRSELQTASAHLIGPESPQVQGANLQTCCVEVRSPQSGRVLRELQESERVVAAGTPLVEIGEPADIEIVVDLLSSDAVRIEPGNAARIEGAGLRMPLAARVRSIEPAGYTKVSALGIEEQRVRVFLTFSGPPEHHARLGHEFRVFARIDVWRSEDALRVPLSALFRSGDRWVVYKVVNGRAEITPVEVGQRNNMHAEVLGGLAPRDRVVLHPSDRVSDGTRVTPLNGAASR